MRSQLESLKGAYEILRADVDNELQIAWEKGGPCPSCIPVFPRANLYEDLYPETHIVSSNLVEVESVEAELKRKRKHEASEAQRQAGNKKQKGEEATRVDLYEEEEEEEEFFMPGLVQPLGIPQAAIPPTEKERQRMWTWTWDNSRKGHKRRVDKGQIPREEVSPKGTVFFF